MSLSLSKLDLLSLSIREHLLLPQLRQEIFFRMNNCFNYLNLLSFLGYSTYLEMYTLFLKVYECYTIALSFRNRNFLARNFAETASVAYYDDIGPLLASHLP